MTIHREPAAPGPGADIGPEDASPILPQAEALADLPAIRRTVGLILLVLLTMGFTSPRRSSCR